MPDQTLQQSELRYRRLFETAQDGILILDGKSGAIVDANPFLIERIGYSLTELQGKQLWQIGAFEDAAASKRALHVLQTKGYVRYDDLPLRSKGGRRLQVEFVSNAYDVDGTRVIQCNIRDITERRRMKHRLHEAERHAAAPAMFDARRPFSEVTYSEASPAESGGIGIRNIYAWIGGLVMLIGIAAIWMGAFAAGTNLC